VMPSPSLSNVALPSGESAHYGSSSGSSMCTLKGSPSGFIVIQGNSFHDVI
jgi:hypothetical protein